MKFSVDQALLKSALARVSAAVEKKTTSPILAFMLMDVNEQGLTLTATNMDLAVVETIPLTQVDSPGRITAPAHMLSDVVSRLPQGAEIEISLREEDQEKGGTFTLTSGKSVYDLNFMPASLFPKIQPESYETQLEITAGELRELINRTRFSANTDEVRSFMSGIYIHNKDDTGLTAVATDGHRIAKVDSTPLPLTPFPGILISTTTADIMMKILVGAEEKEKVTLEFSPVSLLLKYKNVTLASKLMNATFPDYQHVIPESHPHKIIANRDTFMKAVDRIALFTDLTVPAIDASVNKNTLHLSVHGSQSGKGDEDIEIEGPDTDLTITFNAQYLLDAAKHVKGDKIEISLIDREASVLVKSPEDESALFVLMPIVA